MLELRPICEADANQLFPLVFRSHITDMLVWDGPESLQEYKAAMREREERMRAGLLHSFAIIHEGAPIGATHIAPNESHTTGDIGLWIGSQFQGRGHGTESIRQLTAIGFEKLKLHRLEARVFVGNARSRRIFEKNGFNLEGTLRQAVLKRGKYLDEWILGRIHPES